MIYNIIIPMRVFSKSNEKAFGRYGNVYKSKKAKEWEAKVAQFLSKQWKGAPIKAPVRVCYVFYWKNRVRGDLNNSTKSLDDAFNKKVWRDDFLIEESVLFCRYSADQRIEVYIQPITDDGTMVDFLKQIQWRLFNATP